MARPLICDLDNVEIASWIIGNAETGDQLYLCGACRVMWMLGVLQDELGPEMKAKVAELWTAQAAPENPEVPAAAGPPKRARRRRAGGHPGSNQDGPDQDQDQADPATAAHEPQEPAQGLEGPPAASAHG